MTKSDVAALLRCCERSIERQVKLNAFPPPQRFGKESLWFQSIVFGWLERRREQQQQWVAGQQPVAVQPSSVTPVEAQPQDAVPKKKPAKSRAKTWYGEAQAEPMFHCPAQ